MYYFKNIPNNILKKSYYSILNKFEIIDGSNIFNIQIYYLEDYLCKIVIRNKEKDSGWNDDVKINIFSNNGLEKEMISIGSCNINSKIIDCYISIKLEKIINNFSNSLKIIQVNKNDKLDNYEKYTIFNQILDLNPNIDYIFFNNINQRKFIIDNCIKYLDLFDSLLNDDIKYMIFICNYLYLYGGFYISFNINLEQSISELCMKKNNFYLLNKSSILELLFCKKNDINIINYLEKLVFNKETIWNGLEGACDELKYNYFFNNYEKITNCTLVNNYDVADSNNLHFSNIFNINDYKFIISRNINMEYLNMNYYLLNIGDDILDSLNEIEIICYDKFNNMTTIKLNDSNIIKIKDEIKYIFKF